MCASLAIVLGDRDRGSWCRVLLGSLVLVRKYTQSHTFQGSVFRARCHHGLASLLGDTEDGARFELQSGSQKLQLHPWLPGAKL